MPLQLADCYSRCLIDNHITEHSPDFMTKFDPAQYVAMIKKGGFRSSMVYACCHNANCYYPTKIGHMHANLKGRDIFGETVALLRKEGIVPMAYYTVVYQRQLARQHPEWRITYINGTQNYRRSWYNCPNHPGYVQFVKAQLQEIAAYDIDDIWIDMTFWPGVCACHTCRQKYMDETGKDLPEVINWADPAWIAFQRARERWLGDFAQSLTAAIKAVKPSMFVAHQFSPVMLGWYYGQRYIANASDYTAGDFYGGVTQQRLGTKILAAFSKTMPYEFSTSRCVNLYDHTSNKSELELLGSGATTLANAGAYFFIDAINPDGTLNPKTYDLLGSVSTKLAPFTEKIASHKPALLADTGLYFSMPSHVNQAHNGLSLRHLVDPANNMDPSTDLPPIKELIGTAVMLNRARMPYRIVVSDSPNLAGLKTLIMNDIAYLGSSELDSIRAFVRDGGTLIATGMTSYYDLDGKTTGDFALKDVFGVSYSGKQSSRANYLVLDDSTQLSCNIPAPLVTAAAARVLGKVTEPFFDPDDLEHFASYHSNPPGPAGDYAGLTLNKYGKGTCIYLYSSILALQQESQQTFAISLLRQYTPSDLILDCNAPSCVELTVLRSTTKHALLLCLVNYQKEAPNAAIHNIKISLRLPAGFEKASCVRVSNSQAIRCGTSSGVSTLELDKLDTFEIIEIQ